MQKSPMWSKSLISRVTNQSPTKVNVDNFLTKSHYI